MGTGLRGLGAWPTSRPGVRANELRQALAKLNAQGNKVDVPSFYGLLAELEVTQGPDSALR